MNVTMAKVGVVNNVSKVLVESNEPTNTVRSEVTSVARSSSTPPERSMEPVCSRLNDFCDTDVISSCAAIDPTTAR